ncbi:hypothetical protein NBO_6g0111 [Nosema bombycis CQ1]|uniref:Uncharacterized protein n=1 Tax=Nosema bombycis (strain CQ1 / CVCC 102059) TaxID=578461 RepID=R0KWW1_NOSB1|nr:hypothetical protein NBO_6g0111 [Nosema bombycis CQ1]|eukprot:EOB15361.1 hypothetical protein NBO_6g0111 [Nosema bombycis CQ1]
MSAKNINKTLMMLVMILKFSILSQPPLNKDEPIDIKIHKGENDSSTEEEIIVLHLFVTPPELNLTKTLIEPTLAPINQKTVVKIKPISLKKDKKTKLVNVNEVNNGKNVIRKETKKMKT